MAILSKTQLLTDIAADPNFTAGQKTILSNLVDSYQDIFPNVTTAQRNALTPTAGSVDYIVWNTDNDRLEYWDGARWDGIGRDLYTPQLVKININAAALATLNSVPVTLVSAPGAGYAVVPDNLKYRFTFGTTVYDFAQNTFVHCSTKTDADPFTLIDKNMLNSGANRSGAIGIATGTSINAIVDNDSIVLKAKTSDPTQGDGTLTIWLTYSIILL